MSGMHGVKWLLANLFFFLSLSPLISYSQGGTWVWVRGSSTVNPQTVYPIQGVADTANNPPALYGAASWIDMDGNFWVFGGSYDVSFSSIDIYSDLWKYNPVTNIWTWVKGPGIPYQNGVYGMRGVAADSACPGARYYSVTWTDGSGDLWLFGGIGLGESLGGNYSDFGSLNDLWKYTIATNQWTWVNGSNKINILGGAIVDTAVYGVLQHPSPFNTPGGRYGSSGWKDDNNNLWLFGGANFFQSDFVPFPYNDLWRYSITTNEWTWMNGPSANVLDLGNYGMQGVETAQNLPPPRSNASSWRDANGNFYFFGGNDYYLNYYSSIYNDVWKFNPVSNMWTWISGDSVNDPSGNYQLYCVDTGNQQPSSRANSSTCQALCQSNSAFTFGGTYFGGNPGDSVWAYNDLWFFNVQTNHWKWVSGTHTPNNVGSYGIMGVPNASNLPPARLGQCQWIDNNGVVWIFGGSKSYSGPDYLYNDVWKFIPDTSCIQVPLTGGIYYSISKNNICKGDTVLLTLTGDTDIQISPNISVARVDSFHLLLYPDSTTVYTISGQSYCGVNDSQSITITVYSTFNVHVTASDTNFCPGDSVSLSVPYGYTFYLWSNGDTNSYTYTQVSGSYHVTVYENPTCSAVSDTISINQFQTLPVPVIQSGDTLTAYGEMSYEWFLNDFPVSVHPRYVASSSGIYTVVATDSNGCQTTSLPIIISSIQNIEEPSFTISPNPTTGPLKITPPANTANYTIEVTNLLGQTLYKTCPTNNQIDVTSLAPGVYIAFIYNNERASSLKFVVTR